MAQTKTALLIFFNGKSNAGGAERMVQYLEEYLISKNVSTKIIDEAFLMNTFFGHWYKKLFNYKHFSKRKSIYLARFASAYLWLYKKKGQLVFSNGESTPFFPVDFVMNNGCYHRMELDYGRTKPKLSRISKLQKTSCKYAKNIITVAEKVKGDLVKYYNIPEAKIEVITNRVDSNYFLPLPKESNAIKTVAYIGRLEEGKGLGSLLKLAEIIEESDNWQLLIACNNPSKIELFSKYKRTKIKVGLSFSNINKEAYSKADLIFYPSHSESFGMVTIEALSAGIPVIATPVGIVTDLAKRSFPGIHILPEKIDENILKHFNNIVDTFAQTINRKVLHEMIKEEFGISTYHKRLDEVIGLKIL